MVGLQATLLGHAMQLSYTCKHARKEQKKMVGPVGLEPTTKRLKVFCSTIELQSRYAIDSNTLRIRVNSFFQKSRTNIKLTNGVVLVSICVAASGIQININVYQ